MTERLYYNDAYLREFEAKVVEGGLRVYLDRTAFYPTSGGQLHDIGTLNGIPVVDVVDEGERIAHVVESPLAAGSVKGVIDWKRRFDFMQQHTGQHLLSAVAGREFGWKTVSVHFGLEMSTVDLETTSADSVQIRVLEEKTNELVFSGLPVAVAFEDAASAGDLRKPSEREGQLRIVAIEGVDRSACGGTHVRSTGEIGPVLLRKVDKIRGIVRLEFACGLRALQRSRTEYESLTKAARVFSSHWEEIADAAAAQAEQLKESEKARKKLSLEAAARRGRELFSAAVAGSDGRRIHVERLPGGALDDEVRAVAQNFAAGSGGIFVAITEQPAAILVAAAADSGLDAGKSLKAALAEAGGRGGGNAQMAQGSLPEKTALDTVLARVLGGAQ
jgi:alanyl-tRNA synthetase